MMRVLLASAALLVAAPAVAQTSASLPVTCSPATGICVTATPVTNPDGSLIGGGGGGSATRTTAAGTSDTLAVPVQGVTNGVPQRITGVGQTATATAQTVVPATDSASFPTTVTNTPTVNLGTIAGVSTETTQLAVSAKLPASLGSKTGAASLSVVAASDGFNTTARGVGSLVTTQVSVATTATLVAAARTNRARLVVTQSTAGPCYFGPANTVSATTGARLVASGASKVYTYSGALYGICPGGAVTVDVDEEF